MIKPAIFKALKDGWFLCILLLALIIAGMLIQIVPALLIRQIIDNYFSKGLFAGVWLLAWFYLAATAGASVIEFFK